jgi:MoaA/NifB/PqqE/SkfB family radical SAM enzyme
MMQKTTTALSLGSAITPFKKKLNSTLTKKPISVLQINLGKRCNLACTHCHVEASPKRTEELSPEVCNQLIQLIQQFPQIQVVDRTGGAPEMLYGFEPIVEAARAKDKQVIVRSNLTLHLTICWRLPTYPLVEQNFI